MYVVDVRAPDIGPDQLDSLRLAGRRSTASSRRGSPRSLAPTCGCRSNPPPSSSRPCARGSRGSEIQGTPLGGRTGGGHHRRASPCGGGPAGVSSCPGRRRGRSPGTWTCHCRGHARREQSRRRERLVALSDARGTGRKAHDARSDFGETYGIPDVHQAVSVEPHGRVEPHPPDVMGLQDKRHASVNSPPGRRPLLAPPSPAPHESAGQARIADQPRAAPVGWAETSRLDGECYKT